MHAAAYPLAPILALLKNLYEMRADAVKYCVDLRRPVWRKCEDIGSWYSVLNTIGFIGVVTNATMITLVSSQAAQWVEQNFAAAEAGLSLGIDARVYSPRYACTAQNNAQRHCVARSSSAPTE